MKIAVISKTDAGGGGASRVAADLAVCLNEQPGISADHWVGRSRSSGSAIMKRLHGGRLLQLTHKSARLVSGAIGFPDYFTPELLIHWLGKDKDYDIYHLHDISTTLSPLALAWLSRRKPVVWTLHDCSPFTGGCIYPMTCENYVTGCHDCPQLHEWPMFAGLDFTGTIQRHKHAIVRNNRIHCIAPSIWMAREAVRSGMCAQEPVVIHYSVDPEKFRNHDKTRVRRELGLPVDRKIVLISSWSLDDRRKGGKYALEALLKMKDRPFVLMTGQANDQLRKLYKQFDICFAGRVNDDVKLAQYYAAADVFLIPTLSDNLPNVVLETMSCGTPCIAFAVGGVPEMVEDGVTGYLVNKYDTDAMAQRTGSLFANDALRADMAANGRKRIIERFGRQQFVDRHLRLYRDICNNWQGPGR